MNRKLYWIFAVLAWAGVLFTTSCSDDEVTAPEQTPGVEFPSLPETAMELRVGERAEIEFKAYENWTVSADRNWVKFAATGSDEEPRVSVVGGAGDQHITLAVGDEGAGFDADEAKVTVYTASRSVEFVVRRVAEERQFTIYKVTEQLDEWEMPVDVFTPVKEGEVLDFTYNGFMLDYQVRYAVRSNFKWVSSLPEWVSIQPQFQNGEPNADVENPEDLTLIYINVDYNKAQLTTMEGEVSFSDYYATSEEPVARFGVRCAGTSSWNRLLTVIPEGEPLVFNPNGMYSGGAMGQEMAGFEFSALTDPDGYVYYLLAKSEDPMNGGLRYGAWTTRMNWNPETQEMEEEEVEVFDAQNDLFWFEIAESTTKKDQIYPNVKITNSVLTAVSNDEGEGRYATMVALPAKVAQDKGIASAEDLLQRTPFSSDIKEEFKQYVVAEIEQGSSVGGGLKFAWAESVNGVNIEPMGEEELAKWSADFGVSQGYVVTYTDFSEMSMAILKLDGVEGTCAIAHTDPAEALYTKQQGWLIFNADMGFSGFRFAFTNSHEAFETVEGGEREATVILMNADTEEMVTAIRVVQRANYEDL